MTKSNKPYVRIIRFPAEYFSEIWRELVAMDRDRYINHITNDGNNYRVKAKLKEEEVLLLKLKFPIDVKRFRPNRGVSRSSKVI